MKRPSLVKALTVPMAVPSVSVGRMIETIGNLRSRKIVGSGMIRLVWVSSPSALRSGEGEPGDGVGQGRRVAGFVLPGLGVHDLGAADAEQDAQHLGVGDSLGEPGVEAGTALLDPGEVEAGRVRDRLQVVGRARSASLRGIAGCWPVARSGTAFGSTSPKSRFCESLR
jgi:hypothetical protein